MERELLENDYLNIRLKKFTRARLSEYSLNFKKDGPDKIFSSIKSFVDFSQEKVEKEFLYKSIIDYLKEFKPKFVTTISIPEFAEHEYQKQCLIDCIVLELGNLDISINEEIFTQSEFEEFKSKLSEIAEAIFDFQKQQNDTNALIFNSIEEIKEQLVKDAEKGKIFGKNFVYQQLAGKLIDMTIKGAATAFISQFSYKLPDFTKFLGSIT